MSDENKFLDESFNDVLAYLRYRDVLLRLEQLWAQNNVAFGSKKCWEVATYLSRVAVAVDAAAHDWQYRAAETEAKEKSGDRPGFPR